MKLTVCGCAAYHFDRIERSWWMRLLFPSRRLYRCSGCGARLLIRKVLLAHLAAGMPATTHSGADELAPLRNG